MSTTPATLYDQAAEEAVIGSLLIDCEAVERVATMLRPEDFYRERYGQIYRAALSLHRGGRPVDAVTLAVELERAGILAQIGGRARLAELESATPTALNAGAYAAIVREKAELRLERDGLARRLEAIDRGYGVTTGTRVTAVTRVTGYTGGSLMRTEFPAARWSVPGLLPEGLTLFVGRPKLGKSWLALGLCVATATGGRALGQIEIPAGDCLYLALEDSPRRLKERLQAIVGQDGTPPELDRLRVETDWPRSDEGGVERIAGWLRQRPDARLVIIDTLARFRSVQAERGSAYSADYNALAPLQSLAGDHRVAVMVIHHDRKMESTDWVDRVSGTLGLSGVADTIGGIFRERGSHDATLRLVGRDVDERALAIRFDRDLCAWTLLGDADEILLSPERREVRRLIEAHGPMTPTQAARVTGKAPSATKKLMWTMSRDGQLAVKDGTYSLVDGGNPGNPVTQGSGSVTEATLPLSVTEPVCRDGYRNRTIPVTVAGNPAVTRDGHRGSEPVLSEARARGRRSGAPWKACPDGHRCLLTEPTASAFCYGHPAAEEEEA